jgi:hypothetical protein
VLNVKREDLFKLVDDLVEAGVAGGADVSQVELRYFPANRKYMVLDGCTLVVPCGEVED